MFTKIMVIFLLLFSAIYSLSGTSFVAQDSAISDVFASSVAWGDYDNDGSMDICISGMDGSTRITKVFHNDGGVFSDSGIVLPGVAFSDIEWGDYDNDGDLDLFICGDIGSSQTISKIYNNDNGVFTDINASLISVNCSSAAWGDYDNDGDLDLFVSGVNNNSECLSKLYNNADGNFVDSGLIFPNVQSSSVKWGDYDNDGWLDILLTGIDEDMQRVSKVLHNSGGVFTDINANLEGVGNSSAAWGDYDNDGLLDIAISGLTNTEQFISKIYHNTDGVFTDINANLTGVFISSIGWGDYDNDGDLDLLITGGRSQMSPYSPYSTIYENANGTFTNSFSLTGVCFSSAGWCDYDNDGDLDVLISGRSFSNTGRTILYKNEDTVANSLPTQPSNLRVEEFGDYLLFQWNASTDNEQSSIGLTYAIRIGSEPNACDIVSPMSLSNGSSLKPTQGLINSNCSYLIQKSVFDSLSTYYWTCQAIDGSFSRSSFAPEASFSMATGNDDNIHTISSNRIISMSPSPFRDFTNIRFLTNTTKNISIVVYDMKGRKIETLANRIFNVGNQDIFWRGTDDNGHQVPTGLYIIRMSTNSGSSTKKIVKIK